MKILVPVKQVSDLGNSIQLSGNSSGGSVKGIGKVINPFCAIALEQAVRLKETGEADEVIVVCISEDSTEKMLRKALASGADRAVEISVDDESLLCPLDISKLLKEFSLTESPDLIMMGKQAVDFDNNQVGQMLAALLNWPEALAASNISLDDESIIVKCEGDEGEHTVSFKLPGLITADLRLNQPRSASLADVMKARSKPIKILKGDTFNFNPQQRIETLEVYKPQKEVSLRMLENTEELVKVIKSHAHY